MFWLPTVSVGNLASKRQLPFESGVIVDTQCEVITGTICEVITDTQCGVITDTRVK